MTAIKTSGLTKRFGFLQTFLAMASPRESILLWQDLLYHPAGNNPDDSPSDQCHHHPRSVMI